MSKDRIDRIYKREAKKREKANRASLVRPNQRDRIRKEVDEKLPEIPLAPGEVVTQAHLTNKAQRAQLLKESLQRGSTEEGSTNKSLALTKSEARNRRDAAIQRSRQQDSFETCGYCAEEGKETKASHLLTVTEPSLAHGEDLVPSCKEHAKRVKSELLRNVEDFEDPRTQLKYNKYIHFMGEEARKETPGLQTTRFAGHGMMDPGKTVNDKGKIVEEHYAIRTPGMIRLEQGNETVSSALVQDKDPETGKVAGNVRATVARMFDPKSYVDREEGSIPEDLRMLPRALDELALHHLSQEHSGCCRGGRDAFEHEIKKGTFNKPLKVPVIGPDGKARKDKNGNVIQMHNPELSPAVINLRNTLHKRAMSSKAKTIGQRIDEGGTRTRGIKAASNLVDEFGDYPSVAKRRISFASGKKRNVVTTEDSKQLALEAAKEAMTHAQQVSQTELESDVDINPYRNIFSPDPESVWGKKVELPKTDTYMGYLTSEGKFQPLTQAEIKTSREKLPSLDADSSERKARDTKFICEDCHRRGRNIVFRGDQVEKQEQHLQRHRDHLAGRAPHPAERVKKETSTEPKPKKPKVVKETPEVEAPTPEPELPTYTEVRDGREFKVTELPPGIPGEK